MTAGPPLIGLAHGSRDPRAAATISEVMAAAASACPGLLAAAAYLDLSEPDLVTALAALGCDEAIVVPLLFSEAFHARIDVPETVAQAGRLSGARLRTAGILGLGRPVLRALRSSAARAGIGDDSDVLLLAVGSSQQHANAAVNALADQWSAERAGTVHVGFATTAPHAEEVLAGLRAAGRTVGIVPLFLAPGLLLDQVVTSEPARGCAVAAPLGVDLAGLVVDRYRDMLQ